MSRKSRPRKLSTRNPALRPSLEMLEDRLAPAVITWTGNATNDNWTTASNWDLNRAPTNGDDVVIPDTPGSAFVNVNLSSTTLLTLNSMSSAEEVRFSSGSVTVDQPGTNTFDAPVVVTGGTFRLFDTTAKFNGSFTISGGATHFGNSVIDFNTSVAASGGKIVVTGTTPVNIDVPATFTNLIRTEGNDGTIIFSGPTTWNRGTFQVGTTVIAAGATLTIDGTSSRALNGTLRNEGTILHQGTGAVLASATTSRIENAAGAVYDFLTDSAITNSSTAPVTFTNEGTIRKTGGTVNAELAVKVVNSGRLEATSGALIARKGIDVNAGSVVAPSGPGRVVFNSTSGSSVLSNINTDLTIAGNGQFALGVGTHVIADGKTLTTEITGLAQFILFGNGILRGPGTWVNRGSAIIRDHRLEGLSIANAASGTIETGNNHSRSITDATLVNEGTFLHHDIRVLQLRNVVIDNRPGGIFDLGSTLTDPFGASNTNGTSVLRNEGTFRKTTSSAGSNIHIPFVNSGTFDLELGSIRFTKGVNSDSGQFHLAAGTSFNNDGEGTWAGTSTVDGAGQFLLGTNAKLTVAPGGVVAVNMPAGKFRQLGGDILGNGQFIVDSPYTIEDSGGVSVISGQVRANQPLTITGSAQISDFGKLTVVDTASLTGSRGAISFQVGILDILPGAVFDVSGDGDLNVSGSSSGSLIRNKGTFRKSVAGTNRTDVQILFDNTGILEANAGTINFSNLRQSAGRTLLAGGSIQVPPTRPISLTGGTLDGSGTVIGGIDNISGLVSAGNLLINGKYIQGQDGTLEIELGGTGTGLFDSLTTAPGRLFNVELNGTLRLITLPGYTPTVGDSFGILSHNGSRTGNFARIEGQIIDPSTAYRIMLTTTGIKLLVDNASDLSVESVESPATADVSASITVNYTVRNNFNATTVGGWTDSVWLSKDNLLDPTDILIGRVNHIGDLAQGESYDGTLTADLPGAIPGNYRVLVQADSSNVTAELNPFDNVSASDGLLNLNMQVLSLDTPVTGTIRRDEILYFVVDIGAGEDAIVTFESQFAGSAELIVRYLQLPTRTEFDKRSFSTSRTTEQVIWSSPQSGGYFVMLVGKSSTPRNFTLTARQEEFDLLAVDQRNASELATGSVIGPGAVVGSNRGTTTVSLIGVGLTPDVVATLLDPATGNVLNTGSVRYASQNQLLVTFDLANVPVGVYDLGVTGPKGTDQLSGVFTVNDAAAGTVEFQVSVPSVLLNGVATATLTYTNTGGTDLPAPLIILEATNAVLRFPGDEVFRGSTLQVLAINQNGLPGVLPAGYTATMPIQFQNTSGASPLNTTLRVQVANPNTPIDWVSLKDAMRPAGISDTAYDIVFDNYLREVGSTVGSLWDVLRDNVNFLGQIDQPTPDVAKLIAYEMLQADDFGSISSRFVQGMFGLGIEDPFTERAQTTDDGSVVISVQKLTRRFKLTPTGFVTDPGDFATLERLGDGLLRLTEQSGLIRQYRSDGQIAFVQDRDGNRRTYSYTAAGRLTAVTDSAGLGYTFEVDPAGRATRVVNPEGIAITFTYDAAGRMLTQTDPTGTTSFTYVTSGVALHAVDRIDLPGGRFSTFEYDDRGRAIRSSFGGQTPVTYEYDSAGLKTITLANDERSVFFRDTVGRELRIVDAAGRISSSHVDAEGRVTRLLGPGNLAVTATYNDNGLARQVTDPLGNTTRFTYLANSQDVDAITTPEGAIYRHLYDERGNLTGLVFPDGSIEESAFDERANVISSIDRAGNVNLYEYNAASQLVRRVRSDGAADTFVYDSRSNLVSVSDSTGTTNYRYDDANRLTRLTMANGLSLAFEYNAAGQRARSSDSLGNVVEYLYDSLSRISELRDGSGGLIARYGYDEVGRTASVTYGNGTSVERVFDRSWKVTSVIHRAANGSTSARYDYTFDPAGNVSRMVAPEGTYEYTHDAGGRLIRATLPNGTVNAYEYDANGNRTSVTVNGKVEVYESNVLDQYLSRGTTQYTYDAGGNLSSATDANGTTSYEYDDRNRLVRVTGPTGDVDEYVYNGLGQRVAQLHNGERTDFLIDPSGLGDVVASVRGGQLEARYVHGEFGLAGRFDATGAAAFYGFDAGGNITSLTDASGVIVNSYQYDPFGTVLTRTEGVVNPFQYGGLLGVEDAGNGLLFMRARFYDPAAGRFTQADSLGFQAGSTNLYAYVGNHPVGASDPSGNFLGLTTLGGAVLGGAISLVTNTITTIAIEGRLPTLAETGSAVVGGAVAGAVVGTVGPLAAGVFITAAEVGTKSTIDAVNGDLGAHDLVEDVVDTGISLIVNTVTSLVPGTKRVVDSAVEIVGQNTRQGVKTTVKKVVKEALGLGKDVAISAGTTKASDAAKSALNGSDGDSTSGATGQGATPGASDTSGTVFSFDPNDILGPDGFGTDGFIAEGIGLGYTIRFENLADATGPARQIVITHQLDSNLDFSNFRLGAMDLAGRTIEVPEGRPFFFDTVLDLSTELGVLVEVIAEFDPETGLATWRFRALDPVTLDAPADPLVGLLPPNIIPGSGEGFVTYTVRAKQGLATGTRIDANASIVFDANPPIATPPIFNTIDADRPTVQVSPLPGVVNSNEIVLSWAGSDVGSGVVGYTVFVSTDGGPFQVFRSVGLGNGTSFVGEDGRAYAFKVQAIDGSGLLSILPSGPQATTRVDLPPVPVDPPVVPPTVPPVVPPTVPPVVPRPKVVVGQSSIGQFAVAGGDGRVTMYGPEGRELFGLTAFSSAESPGGVRTAVAEVTGDGVPDLIVSNGPGGLPEVRIFDGVTLERIRTIEAFESSFLGGVFVAAGDLNGDGIADLVLSPDEGGGPRVRIFGGGSFTVLADFFGIDDLAFRGGARTAVGDFNGDGNADLIVAAGFGGGPRIAVFDGATLFSRLSDNGQPDKLFGDIFVFEDTVRNGVFIAAADVTGDGRADLIAGGGPGGGPRIMVLNATPLLTGDLFQALSNPVANFFVGDVNDRGGIRIVAKDFDEDPFADLVAVNGPGVPPQVTRFSGQSLSIGQPTVRDDFTPNLPELLGGVYVG